MVEAGRLAGGTSSRQADKSIISIPLQGQTGGKGRECRPNISDKAVVAGDSGGGPAGGSEAPSGVSVGKDVLQGFLVGLKSLVSQWEKGDTVAASPAVAHGGPRSWDRCCSACGCESSGGGCRIRTRATGSHEGGGYWSPRCETGCH